MIAIRRRRSWGDAENGPGEPLGEPGAQFRYLRPDFRKHNETHETANITPPRTAAPYRVHERHDRPPKGVSHTREPHAQNSNRSHPWEWTRRSHAAWAAPITSTASQHRLLRAWSGATLEMLPKFESDTTWDRLASGELTVFSAVPTIYHRLIRSWEAAGPDVQHARSRGCQALRLMMSGSAALPRTLLDRWKDISGHVLLERYGMTEVGMALSNPLHGERRPGFVGEPLPGVSARLVDGELQLKGAGVFSEYWRQPDSTRDAFVDGWFRTGDAAVIEDGAYRLLGRSSVDILKSGGHKISALEIEEVLRTHPALPNASSSAWTMSNGDSVSAGRRAAAWHHARARRAEEWARRPGAVQDSERSCLVVTCRETHGQVVKPEVSTFFARLPPPARQHLEAIDPCP